MCVVGGHIAEKRDKLLLFDMGVIFFAGSHFRESTQKSTETRSPTWEPADMICFSWCITWDNNANVGSRTVLYTAVERHSLRGFYGMLLKTTTRAKDEKIQSDQSLRASVGSATLGGR